MSLGRSTGLGTGCSPANRAYLLSASFVPGTVLASPQESLFSLQLNEVSYYQPHFRDEEAEVQTAEGTYSRLQVLGDPGL